MKTGNLLLIVIVAVIAGFFLRTVLIPCRGNDTINDTIYVPYVLEGTINEVHPAPISISLGNPSDPIIRTLYDSIFLEADTAAIFADYRAVRQYSNVVIDSAGVYIYYDAKTSLNRLYDVHFDWRFTGQDKIINNYPNRFYWGAAGSYTDRPDVYLSFAYQRERYLYFGGLNNRAFLFSVMRSF